MLIRDKHIDPAAKFVQHIIHTGLAPAINLTNAVIRLLKLPIDIKVLRMAYFARTVTGAVSFQAVLSKAEGIIVPQTSLSIATTVTSFRTNGILTYLAAGAVKTKAATDNLPFSAAHTINGLAAAGQFWGAVLVQIDAAGAVSTKVITANQVFASEAAAIAALPAPDALKVKIGHITIRNVINVAFTCNTTALNVGGSTVNYYSDVARNVQTAAAVPIAAQEVVPALSAAPNLSFTEGEDDEYLALLCTTDGTGALVDGGLNMTYRPQNLRGDPA